jgi:hypothetical protein
MAAASVMRVLAAAILGGNVCPSHGGAAPQLREAAKDRLLALVDPALERLAGLLASGDERVAIQACRLVLDAADLDTVDAPKDEARLRRSVIPTLRGLRRPFSQVDESERIGLSTRWLWVGVPRGPPRSSLGCGDLRS